MGETWVEKRMRKTLIQLTVAVIFSLVLIFNASAQKIKLTWSNQPTDSLGEYFIYKKVQGQTNFELIGQVSARDSIFWDNYIIINTNIYYAVTSVDSDGFEGPFSRAASVFISDRYTPFGEFEVLANLNDVHLSWTVWEKGQSWSFEILRSRDDKLHFQRIGYLAFTPEMIGNRLQFIDRKLAKGHYFYKIVTNGKNGGVISSEIKKVETSEPAMFSLEQNYPNPFNTATKIRFGLRQSNKVKIAIFDLKGREVVELIDAVMSGGAHEVKWDGTDSFNVPVASGAYLVILRVGNYKKVRRIVLLK